MHMVGSWLVKSVLLVLYAAARASGRRCLRFLHRALCM